MLDSRSSQRMPNLLTYGEIKSHTLFKWWSSEMMSCIIIAATPTRDFCTLITGVMVMWLRMWRWRHHSPYNQGRDWPLGKLWLLNTTPPNKKLLRITERCVSLFKKNILVINLTCCIRFRPLYGLVWSAGLLHKDTAAWKRSWEHPVKSSREDFQPSRSKLILKLSSRHCTQFRNNSHLTAFHTATAFMAALWP